MDLLAETDGLSSARIKVELKMGDDRYDEVREELIDEGLAEKYVCRGGGLRLTRKGEKDASPESERQGVGVGSEKSLYEPLVNAIVSGASEVMAFDTSSLRKRGKWQNPDITQISVELYPLLRRRRVVLTTYEVKQWGAWDVTAVFEAASHARFAHEVYVVLEWAEPTFSISDPRIGHISRECQRFGVGLATMELFYKKYQLHVQLESPKKKPADADVESWLDYAFSRRKDAKDEFVRLMDASEPKLQGK
ncbi:hypothetical protein EON82_25205 [bacterium]|nr:MAG: hypothetical protein EON82_25205 [bacterium]